MVEEVDNSAGAKSTSSSQNGINKRLVANSTLVNVSNANQYFYYEIMQTSYLYIILVYVYQLDERDLEALVLLSGDDSATVDGGQVDLSLVDEMCVAFLEVLKLLNDQSTKNLTDLTAKFEFIIASLLQDDKYFLKVALLFFL